MTNTVIIPRTAVVVFSYNRAMQVEAVLRSLILHCTDVASAQVTILFKAEESHQNQYRRLREEYKNYGFIHFLEEHQFHQDLLSVLEGKEYLLFLVDDNIFVADFSLQTCIHLLSDCPEALGVSLRLGKNTTYCYPLDKDQSLPPFETVTSGEYLKYKWTEAEYDFGYPLEVSSSLYRTRDLLPLLKQLPFTNPNSLEALLDANKTVFQSRRPYLFCPLSSRTFCAPVNIVQSFAKDNRVGLDDRYTVANMAQSFASGKRIDVRHYVGFVPNACHQEVKIHFRSFADGISFSLYMLLERLFEERKTNESTGGGTNRDVKPLLREGIRYLLGREFEDAAETFCSVLAIDRENIDAVLGLALIADVIGDPLALKKLEENQHRFGRDWRFHSFKKDNWSLLRKYFEYLEREENTRPEISIIVPVYNAEAYLEESLESLLNQTFTDFELILVDDGSTDRTKAIINTYRDDRIVFLENEANRGVIFSLNRGLLRSRGKYIARADADDIYDLNRLMKQFSTMEAHPEWMLLGSSMSLIDEQGCLIGIEQIPTEHEQIERRLVVSNSFAHPSLMIRTRDILRCGGYLYDRIHAEDYDLWCRMHLNLPGESANLEQSLIYYRVQQHSVSQTHSDKQLEVSLAVGKHFAEQKAGCALPFNSYRALSRAWHNDWRYWQESHYLPIKKLLDWVLKVPLQQARWKTFFHRIQHASLLQLPDNRRAIKEPVTGRNVASRIDDGGIRVIAIIAAYNEGDVIYHVIGDLIDQGVQVYLIDHHSTDNTVAEASKWLGRGLIRIETFPEDAGYDLPADVYSWRYILKRKEEIAKSLGPGWYIHADADEFRESPWPGMRLKDALEFVDAQGYNAVEFKIYDFKPTDDSFPPGEDVRNYLRYYSPPAHPWDNVQLKCWKYFGQDFVLWKSGGHIIEFEGKKVYPVPFIMRHYPIRSQAHGERKVFAERKNRFDAEERRILWHAQYDHIEDPSHRFVRDKRQLVRYDDARARLEVQQLVRGVETKVTPLVSIIIPVYNQLAFTHQCLKAVLRNTAYPNYEVIVVDDGSTDDTAAYLRAMVSKGIRWERHSENRGFVHACNTGARVARGEYIVLLNNDTEVQPGWLTPLVTLALENPQCGGVGAKLVYPDGKLQEAGGIIFADGSGWNYGRGLSPADPRFNFVREVDYCSGAALLVRRDLWERLGGLDERYAPAYYEDADLCFGIRKLGYRVYYHPHSVVVHHEGKTAGTDLNSGVKQYQKFNQEKFTAKWSEELRSQYAHRRENVVFASQRDTRGRVLVVDPFLPFFDRASGSRRLFQMVGLLREMGYHVTYIARSPSLDNQYRPVLEKLGIEVYSGDIQALQAIGFKAKLDLRPISYKLLCTERQFDYAILNFWEIAEYYLPLLRKISPRTTIIVDTHDIHFVRELREAERAGSQHQKKKALRNRRRELAVYRQADRLWVVTENDRQAIKELVGEIPIDIFHNIHEPVSTVKEFNKTSDLLFVGNFAHLPNQDAVTYFCREIYPKIQEHLPEVRLWIVGNSPPDEIKAFASERITVTGYVKDLSPYLYRARVSVDPLRYGAGMKGKIGEALAWGLPVVTTRIGAEGMGLVHGKHALIADDPEEFARCVVELYRNRELWNTLSGNGKALTKAQWSSQFIKKKLERIFSGAEPAPEERPLVSIIMLTYNALEYTRQCIESLQAYTEPEHEVIFVDNGSRDGTVEYLRELVAANSHYRLIENKRNLGFAAGNNQGMAVAKGDYLLLLNNDVLVPPRWLNRLVACAELDASIGIVGPLTNRISGFQRVTNFPYSEPREYLRVAARIAEINHRKYTPRRRVAGFAMMIKRSVYEAIGGLDEQFGSGNYEDDDYCLRAREAGFAVMVAEDVFLHHFGSRSFRANRIDYEAAIKKNRKKFERKWPGIQPEWLLEITGRLVDENERRLEEAEERLKTGDYQKAEELYRQVLETDPINVIALLGMARVFQSNERYGDAEASLRRLLRVVPEYGAAHYHLGLVAGRRGDLTQAVSYLKKAVNLDPGNYDARRMLSEYLIELGRYEEGVKILDSILQENPDHVPALIQMGALYVEAGKPNEARPFFERALIQDPANQQALAEMEALS
jgi:GT2 family glycosyltransferase/Tfp pilus assembly protein PilF